MGQILHGCAKMTEAVRWAIQNSQESLSILAKRYAINPKTVAKWKKRNTVQDASMGPKDPCSTVLKFEEEAICLALRKHTLLPLDDCLYALQANIPKLTRSSLHRLFQRHDISRLPEIESDKTAKKKFKPYPIGYFHIDIAEVRTEEGKLFLFVAIDRTSKFVYVELLEEYGKAEAAQFLRHLIKVIPYRIHTILTDNGIQFTNRKVDKYAWMHIFDRVCHEHKIEHRLTKVSHPWTNGQVERMNRTLKEATVKRYFYDSHARLKQHLYDFVNAYNFAKRLKTLKGLTPYEFIIKTWQIEPERFTINPSHHNVGLNTANTELTHGDRCPEFPA
jgi:transposase-like protein